MEASSRCRCISAHRCLFFDPVPKRSRSQLLLTPTFVNDFPLALDLLYSVLEELTDIGSVSARLVVSSAAEVTELSSRIIASFAESPANTFTCPAISRSLGIGIVSLEDVLCDQMALACSNTSTLCDELHGRQNRLFKRRMTARQPGAPKPRPTQTEDAMMSSHKLICVRGSDSKFVNQSCRSAVDIRAGHVCTQWKVGFQLLKKLYGARYFEGWEDLLLLDSDSLFLKPTSMRRLIADYSSSPIAFTSTEPRDEGVHTGCAAILGMPHAQLTDPARQPIPRTKRSFFDQTGTAIDPPWGYFGWVWQRHVVLSLFARVEERAAATFGGGSILNDTRQEQDLGRVTLTDVVATVFNPSGYGECFAATLYWMWAVHAEAPRPSVGAHVRFYSPAKLLGDFFPGLAAIKVSIRTLEAVSNLLLLKHPSLPPGSVFRSFLGMCRTLSIGFQRTMRLGQGRSANLQSTGPGARNQTIHMFEEMAFTLPPDVEFYSLRSWIDQLACLYVECPSLAVHPMGHQGVAEPLLARIRTVLKDRSLCAALS